jgi:hypothetical protein
VGEDVATAHGVAAQGPVPALGAGAPMFVPFGARTSELSGGFVAPGTGVDGESSPHAVRMKALTRAAVTSFVAR